jgi:hypothetical protein
MIRLAATTSSLEMVLAGAISTVQPEYTVSWCDGSSSAYAGKSKVGALNGVTAVTVVPAPAAGVVSDIDYLSITNSDSSASTVTVNYNDNGTLRKVIKIDLGIGDTLHYTHGSGWRVMAKTGATK